MIDEEKYFLIGNIIDLYNIISIYIFNIIAKHIILLPNIYYNNIAKILLFKKLD